MIKKLNKSLIIIVFILLTGCTKADINIENVVKQEVNQNITVNKPDSSDKETIVEDKETIVEDKKEENKEDNVVENNTPTNNNQNTNNTTDQKQNNPEPKPNYNEACYNVLISKLSSYPDYGKNYFEQFISGYSESERNYAFNKANVDWNARCNDAIMNEIWGIPNYNDIYNSLINKGFSDSDISNAINDNKDAIASSFASTCLSRETFGSGVKRAIANAGWDNSMVDLVLSKCEGELYSRYISDATSIPMVMGGQKRMEIIRSGFSSEYISQAELIDWNALICKTWNYWDDQLRPDKSIPLSTPYLTGDFTDEERLFAEKHHSEY